MGTDIKVLTLAFLFALVVKVVPERNCEAVDGDRRSRRLGCWSQFCQEQGK